MRLSAGWAGATGCAAILAVCVCMTAFSAAPGAQPAIMLKNKTPMENKRIEFFFMKFLFNSKYFGNLSHFAIIRCSDAKFNYEFEFLNMLQACCRIKVKERWLAFPSNGQLHSTRRLN